MRIVWKLIGDRLGEIYRSMKKSSTILPWQASTTLWRTKLNWWLPPAEDMATGTNSSIRPRPGNLHMSETNSHSSNHSSNNRSRNSLPTRPPKAANEATGQPSPSQPTPAAANQAYRGQTNTANQAVEHNHPAYRQHHGSQRRSSKADVLPAYAYDADLRTIRPVSALNTYQEVTHCSRTRHSLQTGMENTKSNDRSLSTINSQKTHTPLSAFGPMGEVRWGGLRFREVGNADIDGDDGQHTAALDRFEVKSGVGEPKSSHVKSVLMRHVQTGHVPHYSWCFDKRWM